MKRKHLTEMKSRGAINDEKILQYIDDCVRELENIDFSALFNKYNISPTIAFDLINLGTGRTVHTFGTFKWGDSLSYSRDEGTLILNDQMFDEPEEAIKNTILHELCHYIVWKMGLDYGAYISKNGGWYYGKHIDKSDWSSHGRIWREVADIVGRATNQTISRTDNYATHTGVGKFAQDKYNYIAKCRHCGKEFGYVRKGDFIKSIDSDGHSTWSHSCSDGTKSYYFDLIKNKG